ncbi:MAG TPA: acyl-CoA carboxylase subunit epsilon [Amycolatopsis sp.]|nr:acyl-CoA carboxylase subunit epsilon [Amycolatopsis sp.]
MSTRGLVRIVRGDPDEVEIAALELALDRLSRRRFRRSSWASPRTWSFGKPAPGAWRASGLSF